MGALRTVGDVTSTAFGSRGLGMGITALREAGQGITPGGAESDIRLNLEPGFQHRTLSETVKDLSGRGVQVAGPTADPMSAGIHGATKVLPAAIQAGLGGAPMDIRARDAVPGMDPGLKKRWQRQNVGMGVAEEVGEALAPLGMMLAAPTVAARATGTGMRAAGVVMEPTLAGIGALSRVAQTGRIAQAAAGMEPGTAKVAAGIVPTKEMMARAAEILGPTIRRGRRADVVGRLIAGGFSAGMAEGAWNALVHEAPRAWKEDDLPAMAGAVVGGIGHAAFALSTAKHAAGMGVHSARRQREGIERFIEAEERAAKALPAVARVPSVEGRILGEPVGPGRQKLGRAGLAEEASDSAIEARAKDAFESFMERGKQAARIGVKLPEKIEIDGKMVDRSGHRVTDQELAEFGAQYGAERAVLLREARELQREAQALLKPDLEARERGEEFRELREKKVAERRREITERLEEIDRLAAKGMPGQRGRIEQAVEEARGLASEEAREIAAATSRADEFVGPEIGTAIEEALAGAPGAPRLAGRPAAQILGPPARPEMQGPFRPGERIIQPEGAGRERVDMERLRALAEPSPAAVPPPTTAVRVGPGEAEFVAPGFPRGPAEGPPAPAPEARGVALARPRVGVEEALAEWEAGQAEPGRRMAEVPVEAERREAERRVAPEERKRVAEMTPEERSAALLRDDLTGLGTDRAWKEAQAEVEGPESAQRVVAVDLARFKALNDRVGHENADLVLREVGDVISGLVGEGRGFRPHGDEFIFLAPSGKELELAEEFAVRAKKIRLEVDIGDGRTDIVDGVEVHYGTGRTYKDADADLNRRAEGARREARGEREAVPAPGERREDREDQREARPPAPPEVAPPAEPAPPPAPPVEGIRVTFAKKPSAAVRKTMKAAGFVWNRKQKAYVGPETEKAEKLARRLEEKYAATSDLPTVVGKKKRAPAREREVLAEPPKDEQGNRILEGQKDWSPEERGIVHETADAMVAGIAKDQELDPTGRYIVSGETRGGEGPSTFVSRYGIPSHKKGTPLEDIDASPKQMAAALKRDKGNVLEREIHEAVQKDPRVEEAVEAQRAKVETAPPRLFGLIQQTAAGEQRLIPGALGFQRPTRTEGREAEGALFTQAEDARIRAEGRSQMALGDVPRETIPEAFDALVQERGPLPVVLSELRQRSGVSASELAQWLQRESRAGRVNPIPGDPTAATPEMLEAAVEMGGERFLYVRRLGTETAAPGVVPEAHAPVRPSATARAPEGQERYPVKAVTPEELAKAEKDPDYFPREETVGHIDAETERAALASLENRKAEFPEGAELGAVTRFAVAPQAPPFFSHLRNVVDRIKQKVGSASDFLRYLKDPKRAVKAEELRWTGLEEWLKERKGKVTRQEMQDFLAENDVQIQETVKADVKADASELRALDQLLERTRETERGWAAVRGDISQLDDANIRLSRDTEASGRLLESGTPEQIEAARNYWDAADAYSEKANLLEGLRTEGRATSTKFGQWQLPGAKEGSYRELLLTLGEKPGEQARLKALEQELRAAEKEEVDIIWRLQFASDRPAADIQSDNLRVDVVRDRMQEIRIRLSRGYQGGGEFEGGHWDEPNVLAHIRYNERVGPNGERVLFVEEVQSDWHQANRWRVVDSRTGDHVGAFRLEQDARDFIASPENKRIAPQFAEVREAANIPPAPFAGATKSPWHEMAMRRIVRQAAEEGFDRVAWINGEETAKRYDLSKQIDELGYNRGKDGVYETWVSRDGERVHFPGRGLEAVPESKLADTFGKEVAERIKRGEGKPAGLEGDRVLSGEDLTIGGEWAKNLYDVMLPSAMKKFGKQWGATVGETEVETPRPRDLAEPHTVIKLEGKWAVEKVRNGDVIRRGIEQLQEARALARKLSVAEINAFQSMDITPEMRRSVVEKGVPKFAVRPTEARAARAVNIRELKAALPGAKLKSHARGTVATMPNGRRLLVKPDATIVVDPTQFEAAYRRAFRPDKEFVAGSFEETKSTAIPWDGVLQLSGKAPAGTAFHESFHAAMALALSEKQRAAVLKEFGTEEDAAYAYSKWTPKTPHGAFAQIRRFFERIYRAFRPSAESAFEAVRTGKAWRGREVLPARGPPRFAVAPLPKPEVPAREPAPRGTYRAAEEGLGDRFLRHFQDKYIRLKRTVEAVKERGGRLTEETDPYLAIERFDSRTAEKLRDSERQLADPLVAALAKPLEISGGKVRASLEELADYMSLRHAPTRDAIISKRTKGENEHGSGWQPEEATAAWESLERKYGSRVNGRIESLEPLAKIVRKAREEALRVMVVGGLLSEAQAKGWVETFGEDYVPLRTAEVEAGPGTGQGFDIRGRESKSATGRTTKADNPVVFMMSQLQRAIVRAEKNKVDQVFAKFIEENPDPTLWDLDVKHTRPEYDQATGEVKQVRDQIAEANDISYKVDGEAHRATVRDPLLLRAMKNLSAQETGELLRKAGAFTRFYSQMVTSWNPEFIVSNFARDIQQAMANVGVEQGAKIAKRIPKSVLPAMKGMMRLLRDPKASGKWETLARELREDGGTIGFYHLKDVAALEKQMGSRIRASGPGAARAAQRALIGIRDLVEDVNKAVENGTRLSVYAAMREAGASRIKASSVAKNVTLNFNRKGEAGAGINSLYVFFNASMQGTKRLADVLRTKRGQKLAAGIIAGGWAMDQYNRVAAGDSDDDGTNDWDAIPHWVKERNLILMRGEGKRPIMFPMPYGFNVLHNLGQLVGATTQGGMTPTRAAGSMASSLWNSFNPLGSEADLAQVLAPTALDPIVQHEMNKDFTGRRIRPDRYPGQARPDSELYFRNVPILARGLAGALNSATGGDKVTPGLISVSPETLDHFYKFFTGGLGRFGSNVANTLTTIARGEEPPLRSIPFARRLVYEEHPGATGMRFRENTEELDTLWARYKHYRETGAREEIAKLPEAMLRAKGLVDVAESRIRATRKAGRPDADAKIEALQRNANKIMSEAREVGYTPWTPSRDMAIPGRRGKVRLSGREYAYMERAREQAAGRVRRALRSPGFRRLDPEEQRRRIESLFSRASSDARKRLMPRLRRRFRGAA